MPKKSDRKSSVESALDSKQQELAIREAKLKAQLGKTEEFLKKAPLLKDKAQKKVQQELLNRFTHRNPVEGPIGFQFDFLGSKQSTPPKKLRKERSKAPLITFALLAIFVVVTYFAWKSLAQG